MIVPGLTSVSFRSKKPLEICRLCEKARLAAIEWGGDIHVPPRMKNVAEISRMSAEHGLSISSYGSYFRVGEPTDQLLACLDTALELGTKVVRIWCGSKGSLAAENERGQIVESLLQCAEEADKRDLVLALEYHGNTLTDRRQSVIRLMQETSSVRSIAFYWQPRWDWSPDERFASLDDVRSRLSHLHVFTWQHKGNEIVRLPLRDGSEMWPRIFSSFSEDRCALLEFVQNDSAEALIRDAQTLIQWTRP